MTWLAPLAVLLVLCWLFFSADTSFDYQIRSRVRDMIPASPPAILAVPSDPVAVENPYGLITSHHWPTAVDYGIHCALLVCILLLIGFLSAQNFQEHARSRAAKIAFVSLLFPLAFNALLESRGFESDLHYYGYAKVFVPILAELVLITVVSMLAWAGAAFTLKFEPNE